MLHLKQKLVYGVLVVEATSHWPVRRVNQSICCKWHKKTATGKSDFPMAVLKLKCNGAVNVPRYLGTRLPFSSVFSARRESPRAALRWSDLLVPVWVWAHVLYCTILRLGTVQSQR